jgi:hypothetical protein
MKHASRLSRRNLLLCLDAFGTLFHPKQPIERQYAQVAAQHGLKDFENEATIAALKQTFRTAFKEETKRHPNYGKSVGLDASKWWGNVCTAHYLTSLSFADNSQR